MLENSTENFFVLLELFNHDDDKAANAIPFNPWAPVLDVILRANFKLYF